MDHSESDLYTIKTQFYTYQHQKVIDYDLEQFAPESQLSVSIFQIRSTITLGKDASKLIENGRAKFSSEDAGDAASALLAFECLQAWNDLKTFGTDDSTYFDDIITSSTPALSELQAIYTAVYLVKVNKDIDQAIQFLSSYIDAKASNSELEPLLVLVQLYLIKGNFSPALKIFKDFKQFPDSARDSIIYQVLESWVLSIKGESDNINNAYYFYDELLSSDFDDDAEGKFRLLNSLFVLTLQLKHYPEAQELLIQIKSSNHTSTSADFVANQITFDYLTNSGAKVEDFLQELTTLDEEHKLLIDLAEKNKLFDEIVEKYKVTG
ncbi:coatomer subunit epsilon [[Candida] railenensis]|uniref:Coatomer subunit epsilon n=1 Tax=[Candida] railenensis TaxID=45579 RepID=A0A9P0QLW8_9ASCO|nr:coatomer subunit epsilon [[Candida] railenensis]